MTTFTLLQGEFIMDNQASVTGNASKQSHQQIKGEQIETSEPGVVSHHGRASSDGLQVITDKFKKVWNTPHLRTGVIVGGVALVTGTYLLLPSNSVSEQQIDGRDGVSAIEITTPTGEVNTDQAEYLSARQREEMQARAAAGESNAAVLVTPTLIDETSNQTQTMADQNTAYNPNVASGLRIGGEIVEGNPRFNRIDYQGTVYYQDINTNQYYILSTNGRVLTPSLAPGMEPSTPNQPIANTQYQPQGDFSNGGGGTGGTGGPVEPTIPFNAEDDPDIQRYRQNFAGNYDAYMAQNQTSTQVMNDFNQQLLQNQQQMLQHRQGLAQSGVTQAIGRVNALTASQPAFTPRNYSISSQGGTQGAQGSGISSQSTTHGMSGSGISSQSSGFGTNQFGAGASLSGVGQINGADAANELIALNRRGVQGIINNEDPNINYGFNVPNMPNTAVTGAAAGNQRLGGSAILPSHVVRAGTSYNVVITKTVNSDHGNVVEGRIVGGPFSGATVYGQLIPQGRNAGVLFSGLQKTNARTPIIPLSARAVSLEGNQGVAQVKYHYAQNYTHMALTSALRGYGDAYANSGTRTTIERSDGTVITNSDGKNTRREVEANIAREFANRLQQDTAHLGNRQPTYIIPAGTVMQMRFSQDWDTTQVSNAILQ